MEKKNVKKSGTFGAYDEVWHHVQMAASELYDYSIVGDSQTERDVTSLLKNYKKKEFHPMVCYAITQALPIVANSRLGRGRTVNKNILARAEKELRETATKFLNISGDIDDLAKEGAEDAKSLGNYNYLMTITENLRCIMTETRKKKRSSALEDGVKTKKEYTKPQEDVPVEKQSMWFDEEDLDI